MAHDRTPAQQLLSTAAVAGVLGACAYTYNLLKDEEEQPWIRNIRTNVKDKFNALYEARDDELDAALRALQATNDSLRAQIAARRRK